MKGTVASGACGLSARHQMDHHKSHLREIMQARIKQLVFVASGILACGPGHDEQERPAWTDGLRAELFERVAEDQAVRERLTAATRAGRSPDTALIRELTAVDSANTHWLRDVVARHGWPDHDAIGRDGASAAFLLVQHADDDTTFQSAVLVALEDAFRRGQAEGQNLALLADRVALKRGQPQRYGTQARVENGRLVLEPLADSANVDVRRAEMGLPPLGDYLRVLDSIYIGPPRR
jgi:hypothetical protein